ncbi:hypothetical protein [Legionella clemsonensis]|uniref:Uncharacterized protein n=1 Tax=Legionella clemsonensis TaxID=1867846 RepID=A0A222P2Y8_9GAMM|nr:hypothetical protein [Legionella clemsonensis]ASQ46191.1 hypothetical protein clem_08195 [Legionella clemsonensis]
MNNLTNTSNGSRISRKTASSSAGSNTSVYQRSQASRKQHSAAVIDLPRGVISRATASSGSSTTSGQSTMSVYLRSQRLKQGLPPHDATALRSNSSILSTDSVYYRSQRARYAFSDPGVARNKFFSDPQTLNAKKIPSVASLQTISEESAPSFTRAEIEGLYEHYLSSMETTLSDFLQVNQSGVYHSIDEKRKGEFHHNFRDKLKETTEKKRRQASITPFQSTREEVTQFAESTISSVAVATTLGTAAGGASFAIGFTAAIASFFTGAFVVLYAKEKMAHKKAKTIEKYLPPDECINFISLLGLLLAQDELKNDLALIDIVPERLDLSRIKQYLGLAPKEQANFKWKDEERYIVKKAETYVKKLFKGLEKYAKGDMKNLYDNKLINTFVSYFAFFESTNSPKVMKANISALPQM